MKQLVSRLLWMPKFIAMSRTKLQACAAGWLREQILQSKSRVQVQLYWLDSLGQVTSFL